MGQVIITNDSDDMFDNALRAEDALFQNIDSMQDSDEYKYTNEDLENLRL